MSDLNPKTDLKLARGLVISRVLAARTEEACDQAAGLINEWVNAFPADYEMRSYGSFVLRMSSALRAEAEVVS